MPNVASRPPDASIQSVVWPRIRLRAAVLGSKTVPRFASVVSLAPGDLHTVEPLSLSEESCSPCGISSISFSVFPLTFQCFPVCTPFSWPAYLALLGSARFPAGASPNSCALRKNQELGDSDELGSAGRKMEAVFWQGKGKVGETHGRRPHRNPRPPRSTDWQNSGTLRNRDAGSRETG